MKSVSGKYFCKVVKKHGWVLSRIIGSHHIFEHENSEIILSIPVHSNKDLPIGTLKALMKDASLTENDL